MGKQNSFTEHFSCCFSVSKSLCDPGIVGSLSFVALLLFSLLRDWRRTEEARVRADLIFALSYDRFKRQQFPKKMILLLLRENDEE